MSNRVKQLVTAVSARLTGEDRAFVERYLTGDFQNLFWQMNLPEQRHALDVAYAAARLAEGVPGVRCEALVQAALLHDIGKRKGDISIADKVMTVLADNVCPRTARRLAKEGRGGRIRNLRHALFIYYRHAERGAALLAACGAEDDLVEWVRCHHEPPTREDALELALLKAADNLN